MKVLEVILIRFDVDININAVRFQVKCVDIRVSFKLNFFFVTFFANLFNASTCKLILEINFPQFM